MKPFILIVFVFCLSCGRILMYSKYKITKPKEESIKVQKKYFLCKGLDTSNMFTFNEKYVGGLYNFPLNESDTTGLKLIQSRFYNSEKKVILNWSSCYGYIDEYYNSGCTINTINNELIGDNDTTFSIKKILLYVNDRDRFNKVINQKADLYIVSFWAKWLGTPSLSTLEKIEEIKNNSNCNIVHIKINYGNLDE